MKVSGVDGYSEMLFLHNVYLNQASSAFPVQLIKKIVLNDRKEGENEALYVKTEGVKEY